MKSYKDGVKEFLRHVKLSWEEIKKFSKDHGTGMSYSDKVDGGGYLGGEVVRVEIFCRSCNLIKKGIPDYLTGFLLRKESENSYAPNFDEESCLTKPYCGQIEKIVNQIAALKEFDRDPEKRVVDDPVEHLLISKGENGNLIAMDDFGEAAGLTWGIGDKSSSRDNESDSPILEWRGVQSRKNKPARSHVYSYPPKGENLS